ncbi:sodium:proton antiporter [Colwellia sp. PAMC 20917]|uniref:Na+/H+ antiporter NhaC family protein n=1 Tax=Colwellia sp. PAMC 20917 TaxID=1816218 RepID=UPI00087892FB|nr:Na+/H+ antiporter NhaC family protein [Colwellia sp. PAMC 20917]AOW77824.1 sodium:proton antiporter [Colwellia sp. PAMC 20917]
MQDSPLSLLPPLVAIVIAIWRKNALLALFCGLILASIMSTNWQILTGLTDGFLAIGGVFTSTNNLYIVSFSLLIGALVTLMNKSGAVNGFIEKLSSLNLVKNARQASMLPTIIGTSIFTDTNLSMFTAGMASQKLFDKYKMSRAKLAYLIDSTCAPVSILLLVNGWGAYVLGLLDDYQLADSVGILIGTVSYNFYAIIAILLAFYTAYSGKIYGPMKRAESLVTEQQQDTVKQIAPAYIMWLPLLTLLALTLILLWITGDGDIRRGSGSFAVFWSIISAFILLVLLITLNKLLSVKEITLSSAAGIKHMFPAVAILVLSFAFGDAIKGLGTGIYVSELFNVELPLFLMAPVIFIAAALMAFATGTSWGTFAILVPIAVPIAQQSGLPIEFLVAAVLGGGVFGDHASPISDTTVVASIASGCDHFEHVKTQLPYALFGAVLTIILYILVGLRLS